jgi:hypothetical protein
MTHASNLLGDWRARLSRRWMSLVMLRPTQTICRYSNHAVAIDRRFVVEHDHVSEIQTSARNASGFRSD